MAKFNAQKIDVWFEQFDDRINALPGLIGETASEYYRENFSKAQWEGQPWAKRKDSKPHALLREHNNLFSSIQPSYPAPNTVRISAGRTPKISYARTHNEGFRGVQYVKPHHAERKGKRHQVKGYARRVNMPKRQFIGPSAALNVQIENRIKTFLNSK